MAGLSYALQLAAARFLGLPPAQAPPLPALPLLPLAPALAGLAPFALDVPATGSFTVAGLRASEKAFVYASALQLLLSLGRRGLVAGCACALAGALHRAGFLGLRRLRLPRAAVRAIERLVGAGGGGGGEGPIVLLPSSGGGGSGGGGLGGGGGGGGGLAAQQQRPRRQQPAAAAAEPDAAALATLEAMGFDARRAADALRRAGNDVQAAIAQLV